jgi:hypothetical protein
MTKYILSGGYPYKAHDGGKSFCDEIIKGIEKPIKILDCLFARLSADWNEKFVNDKDFFSKHLDNFELTLATVENFVEQVKNTDVVFFQGGNPRLLMETLNTILDWKNFIDGKIIVASSAGADALVSYYGVGRTMNIGTGFGMVPIKFIPHWQSDYGQGLLIDWNQLLENLKSHEEEKEVVILRDGEFKVIEL